MRIAIVGGGISGLAAAHRVTELLPHAELVVFEAAERLGGVLDTVHRDGFLVERSADSLITKLPWAADLCRRLELADELLPTDESRRRALVVRDGKLLRVPDGFVLMRPTKLWPIVTTPVLSWRGKLRLLAEPLIPRHPASAANRDHSPPGGDESVAAFATRRLGREVFERLVQPLVAGIYTADPQRLSMAATLPELLAMERESGSLFRGQRRRSSDSSELPAAGESGARYGLFVAPRAGMASIVEALANRLPGGAVRLSTTVSSVQRDDSGWILEAAAAKSSIEPPASNIEPRFDAVIVALPAHAAAKLLADGTAELAAELAQIEYAGCAVVSVGYRRAQLGRPLDGFGFVVPRIEGRPIIAASFASEKFPGRAPEGCVLIRVFAGGALEPELVNQTDERLARLAHGELAALLSINGGPLWADVARWPRSMPQYHVGHLDRVARIEAAAAELPGLELAGNAYHGVGIAQCIHSGEAAAERVAAWLTRQ